LPACLLSGVGFAAIHIYNFGEDPLGLSLATVWGFGAALTVIRTGTISWIVGFHIGWDWFLGFFCGARVSGIALQGRFLDSEPRGLSWVSGGSAGPEGSVFAMLVTIFWIALLGWRFGAPFKIFPAARAGR